MLSIFCCICLIWVSCGREELPLQAYYYPMQEMVYVYTANDSFGVEYWVLKPEDDKLTTTVYSGGMQRIQKSIESMYDNGVNLDSLFLFQSGHTIQASIQSGFVFPFEAIDSSEVVFYRIAWESEEIDQKVTYELIRNRRFSGFELKQVNGAQEKCAVFTLEERIISDMEGSLELSTKGEEWYAENIGLVYRLRQINPELKMEQKFLQKLSTEDFTKLLQ